MKLATPIKNPNDNLSRLATTFTHIAKGVEMDLQMDGSGECSKMIMRGAWSSANHAAKAAGYKGAQDAIDAFTARTTGKWVYHNGLFEVMHGAPDF